MVEVTRVLHAACSGSSQLSSEADLSLIEQAEGGEDAEEGVAVAVEAVRLFRLAAEQGHADAQFNLGVACANGNGTKQNVTEVLLA